MSFATATRRFSAQVSTARAALWPVTVQLADLSTATISKYPSKIERVQQEQGAGWVKRTIATFSFPVAGSFAPAIGAQWTITVYAHASEVGTVWRCFELTPGDANTGADHRCVCFKLD